MRTNLARTGLNVTLVLVPVPAPFAIGGPQLVPSIDTWTSNARG